jgi:hypothetical protein
MTLKFVPDALKGLEDNYEILHLLGQGAFAEVKKGINVFFGIYYLFFFFF